MRASEDLFLLINTLTKNEKVYFKKFSSLHGGSKGKNYIKLFDEIEKQSKKGKYDEEKIKSKFKNESFIKQLHTTKNYLYSLILKSLKTQYYSEESAGVFEGLLSLRILFRRNLYNQSYKILKRVKARAYEKGRYTELLHILAYESRIERQNFLTKGKSRQNEIYRETVSVLKIIENLNEYDNLSRIIYSVHVRRGKEGSSKEIAKLHHVMKHPLLQNRSKALSPEAAVTYYIIKTNYYNIIGDKKNDYLYMKEQVKYLDSQPVYIKHNMHKYLSGIYNYLVLSLERSDFADIELYLKKVKSIYESINPKQRENKTLMASAFRMYYLIFINYCIVKGDPEGVLSQIKDIEKGLEEYKSNIEKPFMGSFYLYLSKIYFIAGNYEEALKWNNLFLHDKANEIYEEFYGVAVMQNLMIHYELNNQVLLQYLFQSASAYFKRKDKSYKVLLEVISFIRKMLNTFDAKSRIALFKDSSAKINKLSEDPEERIHLGFQDYKGWMESKAMGIEYDKILKRQFREYSARKNQ